MVGRRSVAALMGAALLMRGGSATAFARTSTAGDGRALAGHDRGLETKGYDVGFVGELTEAAVYVDEQSEALLRAEGYTDRRDVEDARTTSRRVAPTSTRRPTARRSRPRSPRTA